MYTIAHKPVCCLSIVMFYQVSGCDVYCCDTTLESTDMN
jgi:hypothetical protein